MSQRKRLYRPAETAPASGVYEAVHEAHRAPHEILFLAGDRFPECRRCRSAVRFSILVPLSHANEDFDLKQIRPLHAIQ
jgi:hypothetical protein